MKKVLLLIVFILLLFDGNALAYASYSIEDFVFYDPVNANSNCNKDNYWTNYNTNTTCYRFIVLTRKDNSSNSTIKVMLDHDITKTTYSNYKTELNNELSKWKRYKGSYDIIDEDTIDEMMALKENGVSRPTLDNISVNAKKPNIFLTVNTFEYINKNITNSYGYWSKTLYPQNNQYAYTITEYGNNRLVKVSDKRGVRPVVYLNKNDIKSSDGLINLSNNINLKYNNQQLQYTNNGNNYSKLQGLVFTNNNLIVYTMNANDGTNGLLTAYNGSNFNNVNIQKFDATGHGNDMAYNNKTNQILLVGPNNYEEIWIYNADTLQVVNKVNTQQKYGIKYYSITYNQNNNVYLATSLNKMFILDTNFNILYTFSVPTTLVNQGIGYYNGYVYFTNSSGRCPNNYQLYCLYNNTSSVTYQYNVKLDSNGKPTKNFGKLVAKYYIKDGIGEIESITFKDNIAYFGYDAGNYKFYAYSVYGLRNDFNYEMVEETKTKDSVTISLKSNSYLNNTSGFTRSSDGTTLTKTFTRNDPSNTYLICDNYGYCKYYEYNSNTYFKEESNNQNNNQTNTNNNSNTNNTNTNNNSNTNNTNTNNNSKSNTNSNTKTDTNNNNSTNNNSSNSNSNQQTNTNSKSNNTNTNTNTNIPVDNEEIIDSNEIISEEEIKPYDGKYPYGIVLTIGCGFMMYVIILCGGIHLKNEKK